MTPFILFTVTFTITFSIFIIAVWEFASYSVYGKLLKKEKLDEFFKKHPLSVWKPNQFERRILCFDHQKVDVSAMSDFDQGLFICHARSSSMFWKWYIADVGRIPTWSQWSKLLDEHRESLKTTNV